MSTTAVRRTSVLLATLFAVVACYTVLAHGAKAEVRPTQPSADDNGNSHRPVIGSGVKFVRDADGTVTQTR